MKNKSKTGMIIFWTYFPPAKHMEILRKQKRWLTDVSWWDMERAQHAAHNSKFEKMRHSGWWQWSIHMVEDGHHLRKSPNHHPRVLSSNTGNTSDSDSMPLFVMFITYQLYASIWTYDLTHCGRDKMATIFQTTFSNAFSWMKTV